MSSRAKNGPVRDRAERLGRPREGNNEHFPFMRLRAVDGLPTMVAAFTTDIPALGNWGEPLLIGPGSIHVAHTDGEYVEKRQLSEAVELYCAITRKLLAAS